MKWQRGLGALLLLIGITVAIFPLLQHGYGIYSQWQLDREFEAQRRAAQGQKSERATAPAPEGWLGSVFGIRTANAAPAYVGNRKSRTASKNSSVPRRRTPLQSRRSYQRMGLVRLEIPKLNVRTIVLEGTTNAQLRRGPAHFVGTAHPGQAGNCAIAGHRNMYGSWFKNLNLLRPGDTIRMQTPKETFTYKVTASKIVLSSDTSVLRSSKKPTLTLVTCMIPYAKHRLVVFGEKV